MNKLTRKLILDSVYRLTHERSINTRLIQFQLVGIVKSLMTENIITLSTSLRYRTLFNNIVLNKSFLRPRCDDDWNK